MTPVEEAIAALERLRAFSNIHDQLMNPYVDHNGFAKLSMLKADIRQALSRLRAEGEG